VSAKINVQNGLSSRAEVKIPKIFLRTVAVVFSLLPVPCAVAEEDGLSLDLQMELEQRALDVNEGELQLLDKPPEAVSHQHQNRLLITEQSLKDGWVTMYQCHSDLDQVASSQIVYKKGLIRNIKITSSKNIGSAQVEAHTVQLENIGAESEICISADKKALDYEDGLYHLRLGPFMRRFLDGYYPMHVQIEVCYPSYLQLVRSSPVHARLRTRQRTTYADIDVWVVGRLDVELIFRNRFAAD